MLGRLFPNARFIFLTRHIRDCLSSLSRWGYSERDCLPFIRRWVTLGRQFAALEEPLRSASLVIRYEDFIADYSGSSRKLARFLGLDPAMLDRQALSLRVADHATIEPVGRKGSRGPSQVPRALRRRLLCRDVKEVLAALGYAER